MSDGKTIFGTVQRLDEFLPAFDLTLARGPTRGQRLLGEVMFITTQATEAWPGTIILYTFGPTQVVLHRMLKVTPPVARLTPPRGIKAAPARRRR